MRFTKLPMFVLGLLLSGSLAANDDTELPAALVEFLSDTQSLSASFEQEIYSADSELIESSAGKVVIERPNRFRWTYDSPEQLIVADGTKIFFYDIEVDQLTINLQADTLAGSPAALLGGGVEALSQFRVLSQSTTGKLQWVRLEPVEVDSDFEKVSLGFLADGELRVMELSDALGQKTYVRFSKYEVNKAIDAAAFSLTVPDYVDVIDKTGTATTAN